jgi:hypothetical protein
MMANNKINVSEDLSIRGNRIAHGRRKAIGKTPGLECYENRDRFEGALEGDRKLEPILAYF